jgi:DNA-binding NarL/FixJ family response regulator
MRTNSPLIAIYDENILTRQLLHHEIEHLGFSVAFSCVSKEVLYSYLKEGDRPAVLLMNAEIDNTKLLRLVRHIKFLNEKIELIIYTAKRCKASAAEFIKAGAKGVVENCTMEMLVHVLDSLFPVAVKKNVKIAVEDIEGYNYIRKNFNFIAILDGMAKNLSNGKIAESSNLKESSVETYKQRIRAMWNCSGKEAVDKAREYGLII